MTVLLSIFGAEGIRGFVWPPASSALIDELGVESDLFERLGSVLPNGRLEPQLPTSSTAIIAAAFRGNDSTVVGLVNRTDQRVRATVDLRGLGAVQRASDMIEGTEWVVEDGHLTVQMEPFRGRYLALSVRP